MDETAESLAHVIRKEVHKFDGSHFSYGDALDIARFTLDRERKQKKRFRDELQKLEKKYNIPGIESWKQGRFIDQQRYNCMSTEWKKEQRKYEKSLIRPYGGTNNALFKVSNGNHDQDVAAYLEEVGRLIGKNAWG